MAIENPEKSCAEEQGRVTGSRPERHARRDRHECDAHDTTASEAIRQWWGDGSGKQSEHQGDARQQRQERLPMTGVLHHGRHERGQGDGRDPQSQADDEDRRNGDDQRDRPGRGRLSAE